MKFLSSLSTTAVGLLWAVSSITSVNGQSRDDPDIKTVPLRTHSLYQVRPISRPHINSWRMSQTRATIMES